MGGDLLTIRTQKKINLLLNLEIVASKNTLMDEKNFCLCGLAWISCGSRLNQWTDMEGRSRSGIKASEA